MRVFNDEFPPTLEEIKALGYGVDYNKKVEEFMTTFKQPVVDKPNIMPEDRNKLRIALIFEELKEYAEASGLLDYFRNLADKAVVSFDNHPDRDTKYVPVIDLVEQFDALLDLQYVLSGAVIENGFKDTFDKGFEEVHRSNMSKSVWNMDELLATYEKYRREGVEVYFGNSDDNPEEDTKFPTGVYRIEDNKVLKSINYSPAKLLHIIEDGQSRN